jgi:hypothetical protein
MFNPPFILVLNHDEVQISNGIPSLHPIVNLFFINNSKSQENLDWSKIVAFIVPSTNNMLLNVQNL